MGFDLNRHWNDPSPWAHPTLCVTKDLVMGYDRDPVSEHFVEIHNTQKCYGGYMHIVQKLIFPVHI